MTRHGSTIVREVIASISSGADVMSALPGLVRQLLDDEAWREFSVDGLPEPVQHQTFTSFVSSAPPRGLGGKSTALLALCGADEKLRGRVERMLKEGIEPAAEHGSGPGRGHKRDSTTTSLLGRGGDYVVARLKRDDPALAERVVSGQVSAYAAARAKGWKPPRIQVTTPERTAGHLRKHMKPDQLRELARLLTNGPA